MSQRDVERTLGRLLTDSGFRRDFFQNPAGACLELGVQLAGQEVEALLRVPTRRLASLAAQLDDRICRLHVENANGRYGHSIGMVETFGASHRPGTAAMP